MLARILFALALLLLTPLSRAGFDPVHEDIDIFMANPSISSERPNILIVLDNTANWNTAFTNEKSALVSVVNSLNEFFNVGLMMFVETGSPNDNEDGSYVRFAVRQMTGANRTALSSMVNGLDELGDKGNNATLALAMGEAYKYFAKAQSDTGWGKAKSDYAGNTVYNALAADLPGNAFAALPTEGSRTYVSPVVDGCQKNFIIYISNGPASENASALATAKSRLQSAKGGVVPVEIALAPAPSGQQDNWADEWTAFMANTGFTVNIGGTNKTVYANTYVIEVDPGTTGQGPDMTALLNSMAVQGKGKYFASTSDNSGASIVAALNQIFNEIQAVNSVFASTTLPVSVNVRGTNLNQVYIGMFRPDSAKAPRWYGNLKLYDLQLNSITGALFLADANGTAAENSQTGFIGTDKTSFWTHSSNFWSYRSAEQNGAGVDSDSPDGDLVEKGAAAQRLREAYVSSHAARKLYTCTTGGSADCVACTPGGSGSAKTCTSPSALSATPFSTANTAITAASMGLGTKDVSPLTAKQTKTVTTLSDRRPASLDNSAWIGFTVSSLDNGGTTRSISSLSSAVTRSLTALTGVSSGTTTKTITAGSDTHSGATYTITFTAASHGFSNGDSITIAGQSCSPASELNGQSLTIAAVTTNTFQVTWTSSKYCGNGTATGASSVSSVIARATLTAHGFSNGQSVTISGAAPGAFNGTFGITVVDANTFTYTLPSVQGAATTLGSATANTTTATATTPVAHGFSSGDSIVVAGASPAGYNGTMTIVSTPSANSFTYTTSTALTPNTGTAVTATKGATTTVTATTALNHGFVTGSSITIAGADSCFNGTYSITFMSSTQFRYTTATACAQNSSASASASAGVTKYMVVYMPGHGFSEGESVVVEGAGTAWAKGTFAVNLFPNNGIAEGPSPGIEKYCATGLSANCFYLINSAAPAVAIVVNDYTIRHASSHKAFVNLPAHGYSNGQSVTIAGADQAAYNGVQTITLLDGSPTTASTSADWFSYTLASAPGAATGTLTAAINTTTARATSVAHGFANGSSVDISGASPAAFNGSKTITVLDTDTFTYTLGSAQGDASGTILAAAGSGSSSERDLLVNWVRSANNMGDENPGGPANCRASVHGDVLHSRPAVINYNRYGDNHDVFVFYGSNDGVFRAIKGGMAADAAPGPTGLLGGQEAWGFVPTEGFTSLKRLRNNSPQIGSSFRKPYFLDGPIGVYSVDGDSNTKIEAATASDHIYLYVGARRGGRYLYSLDVTDPVDPKFRWKIDSGSSGFSELGYTWSQPTVVTGVTGYTNPILIFGGGYDPAVEDIENCTITAASSTAVTYNNGTVTYTTGGTGCTISGGSTTTVNRSMGRAIYVVDAVTGEQIWSAGRTGSGASLEVAGMDYAIASDVTVIRNQSGGNTNRAYVGDMGGNLWRLDFGDANKANWKVTKIASITDLGTAAGRRKFMYPPDVVRQTDLTPNYDAVMLGSGDREHPFDNTVVNRFYVFRDHGNDSGPATGTTYYLSDTDADSIGDTQAVQTRAAVADGSGNPVITHSGTTDGQLYDATDNCIQEACSGSTAAEKTAAIAAAQALLAAADGWFITLGTGEKTIGNAVALAGIVLFNTNQPSQTSDNCASNLGIARQYQVAIQNAGAAMDTDKSGTTTKSDRASVHAGGGYLPSPVHVVVQVTDSTGALVTKEGVISGTSVVTPTTGAIGQRTRRFWYKEID